MFLFLWIKRKISRKHTCIPIASTVCIIRRCVASVRLWHVVVFRVPCCPLTVLSCRPDHDHPSAVHHRHRGRQAVRRWVAPRRPCGVQSATFARDKFRAYVIHMTAGNLLLNINNYFTNQRTSAYVLLVYYLHRQALSHVLDTHDFCLTTSHLSNGVNI